MAKHRVTADMGTFDVGMVDVVFKAFRNGSLLGRLKISQGGIEWKQAGGKKYVYSMGWQKFEITMVNEGRLVKKDLKNKPLRHRLT